MSVGYLYDSDLRVVLAALLRQNGGTATILERDLDWALTTRPRPHVRAIRRAEPPYDLHVELIEGEAT